MKGGEHMGSSNQRDVFVKNLKKYMASKDVSQSDIVVALGLTASTVSDWVKGRNYPRVDAMQKLAEFLDVKISDLTSEEGENRQNLFSDEDERELIEIFRKLNRRGKHEMMARAYELEKSMRKERG